jgi:peptidoglycan/xylan/chitin deacetylase (PgdA/CDA1 family)
MYHGIGWRSAGSDPHNLFVLAEDLHQQLSSLLARGWQPVDLQAYLTGRASGRSFLVTFDDGYRSVLDLALPILTQLGVPAVCFVVADHVGGHSSWMPEMPDEPLLDAAGLRSLSAGGVEIGGHGWNHTAMAALDGAALRRDTVDTAAVLAEIIGRPPRAFAYPYGAHDAAAREAVAVAGYQVSFATYHAAGPMAVPRVDVNARDTPRSFRLKTTRIYPWVRRTLGVAPKARSTLHEWVGKAAREGDPRS